MSLDRCTSGERAWAHRMGLPFSVSPSARADGVAPSSLIGSFILFTDVDIDRKIEFKFKQVDTDGSGAPQNRPGLHRACAGP